MTMNEVLGCERLRELGDLQAKTEEINMAINDHIDHYKYLVALTHMLGKDLKKMIDESHDDLEWHQELWLRGLVPSVSALAKRCQWILGQLEELELDGIAAASLIMFINHTVNEKK